jgi:hypothetical protein
MMSLPKHDNRKARKQFHQHAGLKHINPHRTEERTRGIVTANDLFGSHVFGFSTNEEIRPSASRFK